MQYFTKIVPHTCNSIDDITGEKIKLNLTQTRWDGFVTGDLNMEPRQPQDFPVTPRSPRVYSMARTNDGPVDQIPPPLILPGD